MPAYVALINRTKEGIRNVRHTVERAGVSLETIGVEMSGSPRDLEERVRQVARHLVRQAERHRSRLTMAV